MCSTDCKGICIKCGSNRNDESCLCEKINKIILGEYIWLCQKEDNQSLEVKREGLITNLV